jgi:hypothetical protein
MAKELKGTVKEVSSLKTKCKPNPADDARSSVPLSQLAAKLMAAARRK